MYKIIFLLVIIITFTYSCQSGNEPGNNTKDPRDYTWTIDTLSYPGSAQTLMSSIWASSPEDVWICGHNDRGYGKMYHYDGTAWEPVDLFLDIDLGVISVNDVWGSAYYNIFAVGEREYYDQQKKEHVKASMILRYNGFHWFETRFEETGELYSIDGDSENNIWACGRDGIVYHFNGQDWALDTVIVKPVNDDISYSNYYINVTNDAVYMLNAYNVNSQAKTTYTLYENNNSHWAIVDSFSRFPGNGDYDFGRAGVVKEEALWSYGGNYIYEWNGNSWSSLYTLRSSIRKLKRFSATILIGVGSNGMVAIHESGDWYYFEEFKSDNLWLTDFISTNDEIFVVGSTSGAWPQKTIILHGK